MVLALVWTSLAAAGVEVVDVGWGFTAVYALRGDSGVVLVDTQNPGKEDRILRRLRRAGVDEDDVRAIVVTHGHPDHAGSAAALADALDVPIVAGAGDAPYLAAGAAPFHPTGPSGRLVGMVVRRAFPPVAADVPVVDTLDLDVYGVDATVRAVGGHTPGSVVVEVDGGPVIVGDLIRSHLWRRHVPALHFFQDDAAGAEAALVGALDRHPTAVLPIHGGALAPDDVSRWIADHPAAQVAAR